MKSVLVSMVVFLSFAATAAVKSPAEVISEYSRVCFSQVASGVSIQLAQAYHNSTPGSQEEMAAKLEMENFTTHISGFPAFETGCNEAFNGDPKFICYSQGYAKETRQIGKQYEAMETINNTPECAYLTSAQ